MGFETPKFEAPKKEQNNSEQYQKEAIDIAQRISRQWQKLKDKTIADPNLQEIWQANRPPKTGIQIWFEGQLEFIEQSSGGEENPKSRMMYRLKEDLERIEEKVNDLVSE